MGQNVSNIGANFPDAFANVAPPKGFDFLDKENDSLADGIGQSYPVIGYRGKVWSIRVRGERHNLVRPDDGTPAAYLDVVILKQSPHKSKSYYLKFDPTQTNEGTRPVCSSMDGIVPDSDAAQKQAATCALCPRNAWRTDDRGKKSRECQDYKRLAVLVMPTMTAPLFGEPLVEPCFLRVPPASLASLAQMGKEMEGRGWHYAKYITRVFFDPDKSHPEMVFRALQGLTDVEAPVIKALREDPQCERIIGGGSTNILSAPPSEPLLPPGKIDTGLAGVSMLGAGTAVLPYSPALIENPPQHSQTEVSAPLATPRTQGTTPAIQLRPSISAPGAFGIAVNPNVETKPSTSEPLSPTPQSTQTLDAGSPDESDAMLDAKITALLKAK